MHPSAHIDTFAREQLPSVEEWPELLLSPPYTYPPQLNVAECLLDRAVAEGDGERAVIVSQGTDGAWIEMTYATLKQRADALAHVLVSEAGVLPGHRVLLRGFNGPDIVVAWFAVLKVGAIAVTTMPMLRATELRVVLQRAQCHLALTDARLIDDMALAVDGIDDVRVMTWGDTREGDLHDRMRHYPTPFTSVATASDDVCLIAFTSGTTGVPKGCMHFHRDVMVMCDGFSAQLLKPSRVDRFIGTPPIAFTFGLGGLVCFPMAARASTVFLEKPSPESLLDAIAATRATITFTAPTFYRHMALAIEQQRARFDTSSLKQSVSAGEALPAATRAHWHSTTGIEMLDGLGATEMMHIFIAAAGADVRPGAIGKAVPGFEIAVLDDQLQPVPTGEVGKLAVRGPTGCRYLNDVRQRVYVRDGWNLTGDTVTLDADGYVYFKARTDDLIITSGYNIGAPEVEAAVLLHDAVAECAVIGVPDEARGQAVKAFVVLKPGHIASVELACALQDHVKSVIAPYKYPRQIAFVDALPKTETGKLQRFRLREPT